MSSDILVSRQGSVGVVTLNRPEVLNAWNRPMRLKIIEALGEFENDDSVRAIVLTGAGPRAFGAGQDFAEAKHFDADRAEEWVGEWETLYDRVRSLTKPVVAALNGVAAGSAFQFALLADIRIGHAGSRMGQPEINAGIPSTTGPWIMREMLGLSRTIELTLTGRLMEADECFRIGLISRLVEQDRVFEEAVALATELGNKPPVAMRLNKRRFKEMTDDGFRDCLAAGVRAQREAYASGEPARMMEAFKASRAKAQHG